MTRETPSHLQPVADPAQRPQMRWFVLVAPLVMLAGATTWSLMDLEGFFAFAQAGTNLILDHFSGPIVWTVFGALALCVAVLILPIGKHRIGGAQASRLLGPAAWFAITLCTTIAVGILFWAMSEPIFHIQDPGSYGGAGPIAALTPEARQFALSTLFMHWSFSPYAIYTICGVAFALTVKPAHSGGGVFGMATPLKAVFGQGTPRAVIAAADASVLLALVLGMAATFGVGVLLLSGGLASTFGMPKGAGVTSLIAALLAAVITASAISGVLRGIRLFSLVNAAFFFVLLGIVALTGPMQEYWSGSFGALGEFAATFVPRSLRLGDFPSDAWSRDWTVFYFTNWFAWAPVTAIFLAVISRGYSVQAFVVMNLVLPSLFSIVWMSVLGTFAMNVDAATGGSLQATLSAGSPEQVMFEALSTLPGGVWIIAVMLVIAFLSYVTAADSAADAIAKLCLRGGDDDAARPRAVVKAVWICVLAFLGGLMITFSGIDGVRMLSNVGGLPGMVMTWVLMAYVILRMRGEAA